MPDRAEHAAIRRMLALVVLEPERIAALEPPELDLALRLTRRARLLGRLAADLRAAQCFERLPAAARDQLESALAMAKARERVALWELDRIAWALGDEPEVPLVCLKGCAYALLGLPNTRGRIFADVDLLLPEAELQRIEKILNARGWKTKRLTPYDDNYYRRWTHELPPLLHVEREVEVDLHHNILPRTARHDPDARKVIESAKRAGQSRYLVPSPEDLVLHAMVHLVTDSDFADKLRDLVDVRELLVFFASQDDNFWQRLTDRAEALDLARPAFYGLHYASALLNVKLPDEVAAVMSRWAPPAPARWLMDRLVPRALYPVHPDRPSRISAACRFLLFVRSHWLRMPPWLLAYHLGYKFFVTRIRRKAPRAAAA